MEPQIALVWYLEIGAADRSSPSRTPLRILGMVATPRDPDLARIDAGSERRRIDRAVRALMDQRRVELNWISTQHELVDELRNGTWNVLHFIGHGRFNEVLREGEIILADGDGTPRPLRAAELGSLLAGHRSLRLAVLNSCEGARGSPTDRLSSTAEMLVQRYIPAVVAMRFPVSDLAAVEFGRVFYDSLAGDRPVESALVDARKAILMEVSDSLEWATPVLFARDIRGPIFRLPGEKRAASERPSLEGLYDEAMRAASARAWLTVIADLEKVVAEDAAFQDAARRLEEARVQKNAEDIYGAAQQAARDQDWQTVLNQLERIKGLDAAYTDRDGLRELAEREKAAQAAEAAARRRRSAPASKAVPATALRGFQPLPRPTGRPPFHLALGDVIDRKVLAQIEQSGTLVFHAMGNTGGVRDPGPQQRVATYLAKQLVTPRASARPAFLYLLGDIVYYFGQGENYYSQFYLPYSRYDAPIFAIPGNHDADVVDEATPSLAAFVANFCAAERKPTEMALDTNRAAMTQPHVHWTLRTPLATIIGLYTNVTEGGQLGTDQVNWLHDEISASPQDRALIVTMHHPIYSGDNLLSGSQHLGQVLDQATLRVPRVPDVVLASHVSNYQRFTRRILGYDVPYIVAGAGDYPRLRRMGRNLGDLAGP